MLHSTHLLDTHIYATGLMSFVLRHFIRELLRIFVVMVKINNVDLNNTT